MGLVFVVLAFVAGFLLVFGVNLGIADMVEQQRQVARLRQEEQWRARRKERAKSAAEVDKGLHQIAVEGMVEIRSRPSLAERFQRLVDESGLPVEPSQLGALAATVGLLAAAIVWAVFDQLAAAAIAGLVGATFPILYVAAVRKRRMEKIRSQLPDAFELMSRTMKAGQTVAQALQAVSDEFSPPIADEFGYCYDQQNLGLSPEASMRDLARRTGLLEIKIFVLAVMVHRQTGGNLSQLLEKLAGVIRERYRIQGAIRSLTAEGRLQAAVLLALPPFMLGVLLVINRPYAMVLFEYPAMLIGMFTWMAIGALWMHKIVSFDF